MYIQALDVYVSYPLLQQQGNGSNKRHDKANCRTALKLRTSTTAMDTQDLGLPRKGHVLWDSLVQTLTIGNIQASQVIGHTEEHVAPVVQALEAFGIVWKPHAGVGC